MKNSFVRLQLVVLFSSCVCAVFGQANMWTDVREPVIAIKRTPLNSLLKVYRTVTLDTSLFQSTLTTAPKEFTELAKNKALVFTVPMPGGSLSRFKIVETSTLEAGLAAKYKNIKTYGGQGIDDPSATIKIDWTELGFHAMIFSPLHGSVLIDPDGQGSLTRYISYNKQDLPMLTNVPGDEVLPGKLALQQFANAERTAAGVCIGGTLRKFRLAVACTSEYADSAVGTRLPATPSQALSAIVTTVNRLNGVYETELDIRLTLVNDNNKIVFTNKETQPFKGNNNALILINESQRVIDSLIGPANYDIGHTFSTGAGGYASVKVVCVNGSKARGVTGSLSPLGDAYNIDFVAHEIGHQFGANHTFNAATGNCGGTNGFSGSNAEPGSGSTIMAYAGICLSTNNLQPNSMPYFHAVSFDEITAFINSGICGEVVTTGNRPPVVNSGGSFVIPKSTPFMLTGSASDADGDALTYSWEQMNTGAAFGDWNKPVGNAPIFRSFNPIITPIRYFPKLTDIINDVTTIGEVLPSYARLMKFRLTARDNRAGGGGICSDEATITVDGNSGPFVVTSPNTAITWEVGTFNTITWDVAKTNLAPISCANVNIELSTDGGLTFPVTLLSNTPNDGMEEIIIPNNLTTRARVRVVSAGNVFFDMSNVDFTIKATNQVGFAFSNPVPVLACSSTPIRTVLNTNSLNKFSNPITLSATGNPAGSTVVFSSNPVSPGSADTITLTGSVPPGMYDLTVTGTAGSVMVTRIIQFTVGQPAKVPVNISPAHNTTGLALLPNFIWKSASDAIDYSVQIATTSAFSPPTQNIEKITDTTYALSTTLDSNTDYYWRVVPRNACGVGTASTIYSFKTSGIVCSDPVISKNVPLKIDTTVNTVISTLSVPVGGTIQDVDVVGLRGTHSYVGDLTVSLISPVNTKVLLFKRKCSSNQDFDLNFDDQATNQLTCPINLAQTIRPEQPLSAFNNESSTGVWKLEIIDSYEDDGGSLQNWGLRICATSTSTLPVTWLTFNATRNSDNSVLMQWSVSHETNVSYYEIERSIDGIYYSNIGKISAGNPTALQHYLFNDTRPYQGDNFYRLKQVDRDGKYSYSKIVKVHMEEKGIEYRIYPNPAIDKTSVRMLSKAEHLTITMTDVSGKVVYKTYAASAQVGEEYNIPVKGLSKGVYMMTLKTRVGTSTSKVIVQ